MDKTGFILKNVYQMHGLAGRIVDEDRKFLAVPSDSYPEEDPVFNSPELLRRMMAQVERQNVYKIWNDGGYWYYVLHDSTGYVIWGPVIFAEHTSHDDALYCREHGVKSGTCRIPLMAVERPERIIAFMHGLLFDEYEKKAVVDYGMDAEHFRKQFGRKRTEYDLDNADQGRVHHSLTREEQMWKWVVSGEGEEAFQDGSPHGAENPFADVWEETGLMAESPEKNVEYGAVSAVVLITRYAIAVGVDESAAYALSDVLLQTIAKAKDTTEIRNIMYYAFQEFSRLRKDAKAIPGDHSVYVEQSRQYIAKNIYKKLSLQGIAAEIGVHPAYLSRIFAKQMGMTLTDYIMREKVQISCNFLQYSDLSIAVIADYISLSPQSYYTKVFKKVMGETPSQYRKAHEDKNFLKS